MPGGLQLCAHAGSHMPLLAPGHIHASLVPVLLLQEVETLHAALDKGERPMEPLSMEAVEVLAMLGDVPMLCFAPLPLESTGGALAVHAYNLPLMDGDSALQFGMVVCDKGHFCTVVPQSTLHVVLCNGWAELLGTGVEIGVALPGMSCEQDLSRLGLQPVAPEHVKSVFQANQAMQRERSRQEMAARRIVAMRARGALPAQVPPLPQTPDKRPGVSGGLEGGARGGGTCCLAGWLHHNTIIVIIAGCPP